MSAYLIFVDGLRTNTSGIVNELGLDDLQRNESHLTWTPVNAPGPGGEPGMLGYWIDSLAAGCERYRPDAQIWTPAPGKKFWVGVNHDRPLRPEDILRRNIPRCQTKEVKLEDGQFWSIPIAKSLPHLWGLDDAGKVARRPLDPFVSFCAEAERIFQLFAMTDQPTQLALEVNDTFLERNWDYDCQALSLLYKLTPAVISALGLLGDLTAAIVLAATLELEAIKAVDSQKKTSE